MFAKKRKTPSVKIPSAVLKKEAEKMAKKMMKQQEEKEKRKIKREKIKEKAKRKVVKKKQEAEWNDHFFADPLMREISAGVCFSLALGLVVLFLTDQQIPKQIFSFLQSLLGIGAWILPFALVWQGVFFLRKIETEDDLVNYHFPPGRIVAIILFFTFTLGLINLLVDEENANTILNHNYGGGLGFSIGYFARAPFGDALTGVIFLALIWISATIGFRIQLLQLLRSHHWLVWCEVS